MKTCPQCQTAQPTEEFPPNSSRGSGHQSYCRSCKRAYDRAYHARTAATRRRSTDKKKAKLYERNFGRVMDYLRDHPCVDCGEADLVVLEFDHVRGEKQASLSAMLRNSWSWEAIENEITKCEVRCANCHRRRTAKQFGWLRLSNTTERLGAAVDGGQDAADQGVAQAPA